MPTKTPGRHRAPGAPSATSALSAAVSAAASPVGKTSAALAMSGGLIAAVAAPASAATLATPPVAKTGNTVPIPVRTPEAATTHTAVLLAPSFGQVGFKAVHKAKAKAKAHKAKAKVEHVAKHRATVHAEPVPVVTAAPAVEVERVVALPARTHHRAPVAHVARHRAPVVRHAVAAPARVVHHTPAPVAAPATSGVLGIAASLAGIPYVWGGTTTAGFDCSGYTQYVFAKAGRSIPRLAEAQRAAATPVSNPQPGDLVFFGNPAFHVGIYAGGGQMWAAPRAGKSTGKQPIWSSAVTYGRF